MTVSRVQLIVHEGKDSAVELGKKLRAYLESKALQVEDDDPDLVLALGGDGTMLRAARSAHAADALLLGVNLGNVGYLTEVEVGSEVAALDRIFSGDYEIEERLMLSCATSGDHATEGFVGLNEVLVERAEAQRLVRLLVHVGGEALATFNADGVIVATPTGSTAYALSAGGPIVSPRASCLVLVPVSAHMIFSRPIVLAPDEVVEITVEPHGSRDGRGASVVLDGVLASEVEAGAKVRVSRHPRALRLVRLSGPGFVERLRRKLDLPGV